MDEKIRAPRNRTITLSSEEIDGFRSRLVRISSGVDLGEIVGRTIHQDFFEAADHLPDGVVDLLFVDPPYNLTKTFNGSTFKKTDPELYAHWLGNAFDKLERLLKPTSSVYVCTDWASSPAVYSVVRERFIVRNRITWEREKGRGATRNWKNASEDLWFCTVSDDYTFNVEDVKLKRKVLAPYTRDTGEPKDWARTTDGDFRLTHPSNLWTDITVPFWSMPENTDHPTQKPEKLVAKIILAGTRPGDLVLDPFLGSGTTSVVAAKLGRRFVGVEIDETYCCLAEKRLRLAEADVSIQGYADGVFWERNTLNEQLRTSPGGDLAHDAGRRRGVQPPSPSQPSLFD